MALWCKERLLVDVIGAKGVDTKCVAQPFARVGTHPESDVILADGPPGSRSLYLHATPAGVFCIDLRRVQGKSSDVGFWLNPTDEVGIGRNWLRARLEGPPLPEAPKLKLDQDESATFPRPVLAIYNGKRCVAKKRLRSSLCTVGRWPQCGLTLQGQLVSGVHCALYWERGRLWCIDLLSSNQTFHRQQAISWTELAFGEKVEVGEFEILFERLSRQPPPNNKGMAPDKKSRWAMEVPHAKACDSSLATTASSQHEESGLIIGSGSAILSESLAVTSELAERSSLSDLNTTALQVAQLSLAMQDKAVQAMAGRPLALQQLEELSLRLQEQFSQIKAEANSLADVADRLNSATLQLAEKRAEIQAMLSTSVGSPALVNSAGPIESAPAVTQISTVSITSANALTKTADLAESNPPRSRETKRHSAAGSTALQNSVAQLPSAVADRETVPRLISTKSAPTPSITKVQRNELVGFVTDRMAMIERERQRKKLLIGLSVGAAIILLVGVVGGLWYSVAGSESAQSFVQWLQTGRSSHP